MIKYSFPIRISLAITGRCNLDCQYCLAGGPSPNELTKEEIFDLTKQFSENKIFYLGIYGGEPLVRTDFFRILEYLSKFPIYKSLNTNATLIGRREAYYLKELGIKSVIVSLDSTKTEIFNRITAKDMLFQVKKGIRHLVKEEVPVTISATVTRYNYRNLTDIVLFAKSMNVKRVRFTKIFSIGKASLLENELFLRPNEFWSVIKSVKKLKELYGNFLTGFYVDLFNLISNVEKFPLDREVKINVPLCAAATKECAIRADGEIIPCSLLWNVPAGNIREEKIKGIWETSPVLNKFRNPLTVSLQNHDMEECQGCIYKYVCFTGHRCYPFYESGGIKNKKLFCIVPGGSDFPILLNGKIYS